MAELKLLGCAYCGSEAEMQPWHGGAPTKVMISCSNSEYGDEHGGCSVGPSVCGETPAKAIAAWNRRPAEDAAAGRIAELEALVGRAREELRLIYTKDCSAVYDTTLRIALGFALAAKVQP